MALPALRRTIAVNRAKVESLKFCCVKLSARLYFANRSSNLLGPVITVDIEIYRADWD